jgi:glycosyltransferase 2 family protein
LISDEPKRLPALRGIINYIISIGLTVVFLYVAFHDVNFGDVMELVSGASIFWIVIFIIGNLTGHYVRALRWKVILNSVKPDAKMKNLFGSLMIGYGVNCVTPKLGEIARAVLIGKWENLSRSSMFGTVILERVIDVLSLGFAVIISSTIWPQSLYESFPWLKATLYITAIMLLLVIAVFYMTIKFKEKFYGVVVKLVNKFSEKLGQRLGYIFEMLTQGFNSLKGVKNYFLTVLLTILLLLVYALNSYFGFFILELQNIHEVTFAMGWILMSVSALGIVIPTPGGTGSYHTLAKSTLVLLFGFSETVGASFAFITHIISYILFILVAIVFFFTLNKQQKTEESIPNTEVENV